MPCCPCDQRAETFVRRYFNEKQWVNYFLHGGHLHIEGLKMSKSLKVLAITKFAGEY